MSALIEMVGLSKAYTDPMGKPFVAVEDVSLTIGENEFVTFLGPSGCGKTTLLKMIDNIVPADRGQILMAGAPIQQSLHEIGFVFQEVGLLAWRDVASNVALGLDARRVGTPSERKATALEYARLVGLGDFTSYYPHQLSGGMQQRVGLARALAIKPKVLLMDEPFGALDAMTRSGLQAELASIWETLRTTVVFVTHDIHEAIFLSDRIVVFDKNPGRVVAEMEVELPRPRTERDVASHPLAHELHARIIDLLGGEVVQGNVEG